MNNQTAYYVPVPEDIWTAAKTMLGKQFDGTVNQLDRWVYDNLPDRYLEYLKAPMKANRNRSRFIWTAYITQ